MKTTDGGAILSRMAFEAKSRFMATGQCKMLKHGSI
ncbi:Uncharacterised protein [Vibrio cholerae]|nr:Uncharacterised protein [Vibrio cholerae]